MCKKLKSRYLISLASLSSFSQLRFDDNLLLDSSNTCLSSIDFSLLSVELGHHLENSLLISHHLLNDFIEKLVRVLGHLQTLQPLLSVTGLSDCLLVNLRLRLSLIVKLGPLSGLNDLAEGFKSALLGAVLPLTIVTVVSLEELGDELVILSIKMSACLDFSWSVQLAHEVVDQTEVVSVVNLFLGDGCLEDQVPDLLVVPADEIELFSKVKECPLIEAHLFLPESKDDMLLEVSVEKFSHVITMELSVVSESFKQAGDFLHSDVSNMILHLAGPEVRAVESSLVRLVVSPQRTKGKTAAHLSMVNSAVVLLKLFENGWVVNLGHSHVVEEVRHSLQGQVELRLVSAVIDILNKGRG